MLGAGLSTAYLGWGLVAQQRVDAIAAASLAGTPNADAPRLVVATPFNTLLWRVVVLTREGYLEGQYSLVADRGPIRFEAHAFERSLLAEAGGVWAVQRLLWFSQGFQRADEVDGELHLSDLRMGQHPVFFFTHAVARRETEGWVAIEPRSIPQPRVREGQLFALWQRIWRGDPGPVASAGAALTTESGRRFEAAQAAEAKGGTSPAASASK
ncbi:MAG: hypothetical protein KatS3mg127_0275 [Silanimonas sp.]|nr:MAG: hypothetical protein KatS3mg127_0275 [Silanimonas sp.]